MLELQKELNELNKGSKVRLRIHNGRTPDAVWVGAKVIGSSDSVRFPVAQYRELGLCGSLQASIKAQRGGKRRTTCIAILEALGE